MGNEAYIGVQTLHFCAVATAIASGVDAHVRVRFAVDHVAYITCLQYIVVFFLIEISPVYNNRSLERIDFSEIQVVFDPPFIDGHTVSGESVT